MKKILHIEPMQLKPQYVKKHSVYMSLKQLRDSLNSLDDLRNPKYVEYIPISFGERWVEKYKEEIKMKAVDAHVFTMEDYLESKKERVMENKIKMEIERLQVEVFYENYGDMDLLDVYKSIYHEEKNIASELREYIYSYQRYIERSNEYIKTNFSPMYKHDPVNIFTIINELYDVLKLDTTTSIHEIFSHILETQGAKIVKQKEKMSPKIQENLIQFQNHYLGKLNEQYRVARESVLYIKKQITDTEFFKLFVNADDVLGHRMSLFIQKLRHIQNFLSNFGVIFMDLYALGRIFRKFVHGEYPRKIIIYAGETHIKRYVNFITGADGLTGFPHEIIFSHGEQMYQDDPNKCILVTQDSDQVLHFMGEKMLLIDV